MRLETASMGGESVYLFLNFTINDSIPFVARLTRGQMRGIMLRKARSIQWILTLFWM